MMPRQAAAPAMRTGLFASVLEVVPELVLIHDAEMILFANAACRTYLDAACPEDLEGRPLDVIIHPDAYVAGRERREVLIHGDKSLSDIPLKLVTLEGTTKRLSVDARPLALANGLRAAMVVGPAGAR